MTIYHYLLRTLRLLVWFCLLLSVLVTAAGLYVWQVVLPQLPPVESLHDVQMQVPLRVYTSDNAAIAEFGNERRTPVPIEKMPKHLIQAVLAAEDDRFYQHIGIDFKSLARAGVQLIKTGEKSQGASTITMQLARNMFPDAISRKKNFMRKFKEMLVALQIEQSVSKEKILELYLNKIFLGHRAYGMGAAAKIYFNKDLEQLSLGQYAMLAGLPKAPSTTNPFSNPKRAMERRNYILKRMLGLNYITETEYQAAIGEGINTKAYTFVKQFDAPYIAEMARAYLAEHYPGDMYTAGYKVYTTVNTATQSAAEEALRQSLLDYDTRHGYRGPLGHVNLAALNSAQAAPAAVADADSENEALAEEEEDLTTLLTLNSPWDRVLRPYRRQANLMPALVLEVSEKSVQAYLRNGEQILIGWEGLAWARREIDENRQGSAPKRAKDILKPGDIILVQPLPVEAPKPETPAPAEAPATADAAAMTVAQTLVPAPPPPVAPQKWRLAQVPEVEGALVSLEPNTGAVLALVGGFNFYQSKFNRVTQAKRQPGSNFKPFVYSAALDHNYVPSTIINDAPMVFGTGAHTWIPENYSRDFKGPMRMRSALAQSRNLVSIRIMDDLGIEKTLDHVTRFGFAKASLPPNLTLALGTPELTPMEIVRGFTVFANGGYLVEPYLITRIEKANGEVIFEAAPKRVCHECNAPLQQSELDLKNAATAAAKAIEEHQKVGLPAFLVTDSLQPAQIEPDPALTFDPNKHAPRVISAKNAWMMTSLLKSVIQEGTAQRAKRLKRDDLAGKTGTTNEQRDAWFSGYNADIVTTVWVGFDQPRSLGRSSVGRETGGSAALPAWMNFMQVALADHPPHTLAMPSDLVMRRIDSRSGLLAEAGQGNAIEEVFPVDYVPRRYVQKTRDFFSIGVSGASPAAKANGDRLF